MALPTISHNSPVAGSIAWTGFGIQYNGQSFNIPPGNAPHAFVWWLYNGGTAPALQSGNALPALGPDDMILFVNKNGIGALIPNADMIEGSLIVGGSILAQAIGVNQIQTEHIAANAVTANEIAANSIVSKHVSAGTITADKLSVGTVSDNMIVNGSFEDALSGTLVGWEINAMTNGTIIPVTGQSSSGAVSMQFAATTTAANLRLRQMTPQFMPVSAASGRKYYLAVRAGASTATTTGFYFRVNWYDANKVYLSLSDIRSNSALTTTFTLYEGQATPPAAAKYMAIEIIVTNLNVVSTLYVDEVVAHEVTMTAQIGDGQITAAKIVANSITADRIQTAAITADKLLVADRSNYWENPDFEGDTVGAAPKGLTSTSTTNARVIAGGSQGSGKAWELNALSTGNNDHYSTNTFPVEPGDQYYVRMDYKFLNTAGTANAAVGFRTYGPTKAGLSWAGIATTGSARPLTWTTHPGAIYTVPAGTYFLQPWVTFSNNAETTNRFHLDDIVIRRMSGGELIVDGAIIATKIATDAVTSEKIIANAITTAKIAANAVTANEILAGAIQTNHMTAGSIHADRLIANSVTADKIHANAINGKTITGATVQTAAGGARIVMDSTGLKGWDANNINYLTADEDGVTVSGTLNAIGKGFDPNAVPAEAKLIDVTATLGGQAMDSQLIITEQMPQPPSTVPGLGFTPSNATVVQRSGVKSTDGFNLIMHSATSNTKTQYGFMSMGDHGVNLMAPMGSSTVSVKGRSGVVVDGMVGALELKGSEVLINGLAMTPLQHAEFTSSEGVPHNTSWGSGTMTLDVSKSINPGFVSNSRPDYLKVTETGVYNISTLIDTGAATANYSYLVIRRVSDNSLITGESKATGGWEFQTSVGNVYLSAGEELRWYYHQETGVTQTWNSRVRITKVSAMSAPAALPSTSLSLTGDLTVDGTPRVKHAGTYRRTPAGVIHRQYASGSPSFGIGWLNIITTPTLSVVPGSLLRVTASILGWGSVHQQWQTFELMANGSTFHSYGHFGFQAGYTQGATFVGFYEVPVGQTSAQIVMRGVVAAAGGTFQLAAPSGINYPIQINVEDIGDY
jgi:hypothetical protein